MAKAIDRHPFAKEALRGQIERTLVWKDPDTGVWLRARPDVITGASTDYCDLKCTASVSDDAIEKTIGDYGYHQQGALVQEGAEMLLGQADTSFHDIFVESERPHCVRPVTLKPEDLADGRKYNKAATKKFARCLQSGVWDGPSGDRKDAEYVGVKGWTKKQNDLRLAELQREAA
jgi:hypothetical protein